MSTPFARNDEVKAVKAGKQLRQRFHCSEAWIGKAGWFPASIGSCPHDHPEKPPAVQIGRLGGLVKSPRKGFGSMSPDKRAAAMAKSLATRRAKIAAAK